MRAVLRPVSAALAATMLACGGDSTSGPTTSATTPTTPTKPTGPATPAVATVTVTGSTTLEAGTTTKLTAVAKDSSGAAMTSVPISWTSSDATMMSVADDGTVLAIRIGGARITATAGGKTGSLDLTSSLSPYTFNFGPGVPDADVQRIKDAVQFAHKYFTTAFGRTITKPTTIAGAAAGATPLCDSRGGNAAVAVSQQVTYCVSNQGWTANGPKMRQKITIHELFHVWQYEYKWLGIGHDGPAWIVEGSAELVGMSGADAMGLTPLATLRGCAVKEVTDFDTRTPPGLPTLDKVEAIQAWQSTIGPLYSYAWPAMEELTTNAGGMAALKVYGDAVAANNSPTGWQAAFQTAFKTTPAAFYSEYPTYWSSLPVPQNYLCGGI